MVDLLYLWRDEGELLMLVEMMMLIGMRKMVMITYDCIMIPRFYKRFFLGEGGYLYWNLGIALHGIA